MDLRVSSSSSSCRCVGMKTATSRASRTAHAPNRKGGPGMTDLCGTERSFTNNKQLSSFPGIVAP